MLNYSEMVRLVDQYSNYSNGRWSVDVPSMRQELIFNYNLEDFQAQFVISRMYEKGLLPNG